MAPRSPSPPNAIARLRMKPAESATEAPALTVDESQAASRRWARVDSMTLGTWLGIMSALGYTATNMALRKVARPGDLDWALWVACIKAAPAALAAWIWIGLRYWRGLGALPPRRLLWPLIAAGLVMQFGGNGMFQWALSLGGLALTVPLTFAALIWSGAVGGRIFLSEPITPRSALAIGVLLASICLLSLGAEDASRVAGRPTFLHVAAAVLAALVAGLAYGTNGVVIRRFVTTDVSVAAMLMVLSTSGVVGLGLAALIRMGPQALATIPRDDWLAMWTAGTLNAVGFFCVTGALQKIPVTRVNLLNSSQTALCALGGVLFFDERITVWLVLGILLTIAGLSLLERTRGS